MEKEPVKKSRKAWWIIGGTLAVIFVVAGIGGSGGASSDTASVPSSARTANISQQMAPAAVSAAPAGAGNDLSNDNYYTNTDGASVHAPAYTEDDSIPAGATAQCRDGSYSFSQHRSGTCSHHGGVAVWE